MKISPFLKILVEKDGSDLYLATGAMPSAKFHGVMTPLSKTVSPEGWVEGIANEIMSETQRKDFAIKPEMNLAISEPGVGRFRVNIFKQRNQTSMVVRYIKTDIPNCEMLGLPPVLKEVVMAKRGIILFVGATGSGKSTSLAALIDHRNTNSKGHIITIEDPIEFLHSHKGCIVNQREVGMDTDCFEDALKNTLRQAPDVILIGEIRDRETMEYAMTFSETGHLVFSTLHANNANQALDRIINFFPKDRHSQLLLDLSLNMRAIISQRLIPTVDNKRCAAIEVLLASPRVEDLIKAGEVGMLKEVMEKSERMGMKTFDNALLELYKDGRISIDQALRNADSENNLRMKIKFLDAEQEDKAQNGLDKSSLSLFDEVEEDEFPFTKDL